MVCHLSIEPRAEIESLLARFRVSKLSPQDWTHRAHLLVAASYLADQEPSLVLPRLRREIQNLNLSHGVLTSRERGYHETLTRVWLALVLMARDRLGPGASVAEVADACATERTLPWQYYSSERLASWEARIGWLPPDLQSLAYDPGEWEAGTPELFSLAAPS